jgi:glycosyltransferase involved in cell wall biosynthesis
MAGVMQSDYALHHAAHVICTSSRDVTYLSRVHRIGRERVTRIDIGVAEPFLAVPRCANWHEPRLLFIGTWIERKGCRVLGTAFARARCRVPNLRLTILGSGAPAEQVLQDFEPAARDAVEVVSHFTQPELLEALARHTLFALPSFNEGMPLSLLEAMAAGLPIIATTAGAIPDVVADGVDGILIRPGDASALEEAIVRCARDAELSPRLGAAGHRKMQGYTWERCARQHVEAFERAVAAKCVGH